LRRPYRIAGPLCAALAWGGVAAFAAPVQAQDAAIDDSSGQLIDLDWSVGLRGSYTNDSAMGSLYKAIVAPEASLTRHYLGGDASVGAGAAASIDQNKTIRLEDAHANAASSFTLDLFNAFNKDNLGCYDTGARLNGDGSVNKNFGTANCVTTDGRRVQFGAAYDF